MKNINCNRIQKTTKKEVKLIEFINSIKINKTPGYDLINGEIIKKIFR